MLTKPNPLTLADLSDLRFVASGSEFISDDTRKRLDCSIEHMTEVERIRIRERNRHNAKMEHEIRMHRSEINRLTGLMRA